MSGYISIHPLLELYQKQVTQVMSTRERADKNKFYILIFEVLSRIIYAITMQ